MITAYFNGLRQSLILNEQVTSFKIIKEIYGNNDGFIRVKCVLKGGNILEFSEYVQTGQRQKITIETYSFHLQNVHGMLIKRWDNAPHHREIATFPHHVHDGETVRESKLVTLVSVLKDIAKHY